MGCCDAGGRASWGVFGVLALCGFVFTVVSGPLYYGLLSINYSVRECGRCFDEFTTAAFETMADSHIPDRLAEIHERNNKMGYTFQESSDDHENTLEMGMCFTQADADDLADLLAKFTSPNWTDECTDQCAIAARDLLKGVLATVVLFCVGVVCSCCAIVPLCMLCCCACKSEPREPSSAHIPCTAVPVDTKVEKGENLEASPADGGDCEGVKAPLLLK